MWTSAGTKTFIDCAWDIWGVLSAPNSMIHFWSTSNAVLNTSFSCWVKKSKCKTEPWFVVILDQISSLFLLYFSKIFSKCLFLTLKEPDNVLWVKLLAAIGSTPGDVPPQIIDIEAVGAIAVLFENLSLIPYSLASGQAPLSSASSLEDLSTFFEYF